MQLIAIEINKLLTNFHLTLQSTASTAGQEKTALFASGVADRDDIEQHFELEFIAMNKIKRLSPPVSIT